MAASPFKPMPLGAAVERYGTPYPHSYAQELRQAPTQVIAVCEGDLVVDCLNLDWTAGDFGLDEEVFGYLVAGNLTVTGHITCEETDGGRSLAVLGDLHAGNIAVGGQLLYVRGSVVVNGIYCGSYNHGESIIDGDVSAQLLISDDYRFWIKGRLLAATATTGCDRFGLLEGRDIDEGYDCDADGADLGYGGARWLDGDLPVELALDDECIVDDDYPFVFEVLVEKIRSGETVLKADLDPHSPQVVAWRRADALYRAGRVAHFSDDNMRAAELFQQALSAGYSERRGRYMLGRCLYENDRYSDAIPHFTYCIEQDYRCAESLIRRASGLIMTRPQDNFDTVCAMARADCERIIEMGAAVAADDLAEAHNLLGYMLYLEGRRAEAIEPLGQALAIDDENHNANLNMARCLWLLDREAEAVPYADRAIASDPDGDLPYLIKGHCHFVLGDYEVARRSCERYLDSHPDHEQARIKLARCLVALNRTDDAYREACRLFESHPEQKTVNPDGFIAWSLWLSDRESEALPYAIRAAAASPAPGYHLMVKGCCHQAAGEIAAALADWQVYARFAPGDVGVWNLLGEASLGIGDLRTVQHCVARVLALDPENAIGRRLERECRERQTMWRRLLGWFRSLRRRA